MATDPTTKNLIIIISVLNLTSKVLTRAKVGGTPGKLLFSDILSVLKLFKLPISGGKERRSFPVKEK